jgi:rhodanese-related sulfurtransferase
MPTKNPQEPFTRLTVQEAKEMIDAGNVDLVDVREPHEYSAGHVPGARLVPLNSLPTRAAELDNANPIVFICAVGQRSALAAEYAAAAGKTNLYSIDGGTDGWAKSGFPIDK